MREAQAQMMALGKAAVKSDASIAGGFLRAGATLTSLGTKMEAVGKSMSTYVTLPLVAIGYEAVKSAVAYEAAMKLIQTQAGGSAKDVQYLSKAILDMKNVQYGPTQLAAAMYHLKSVGMDNRTAMDALRAASEGAAVGQADLEATTSALAGVWKSGITGAHTFTQAMGTVNAIVGSGNMRMNDFVSGLSTGVVPIAKDAGLSLSSLGAAMARMTDMGIPATRASTYLRMAIIKIIDPTAAALKLASTLHVSFTTMQDDLTKPDGLVVALGYLQDHIKNLSAQKQLSDVEALFGGVRGGTGSAILMNNLTAVAQKYKQITDTAGNFNADYAAQSKTTAAQWAMSVAELKNAGIIIGTDLMPYVHDLAKDIHSAFEDFNNLSPATKKLIVHLGLVAAALGPGVAMGGKLLKTFGWVYTSIGSILLRLKLLGNSGELSNLTSLAGRGAGAAGVAGAEAGTSGAAGEIGIGAADAAAAGLPVVLVGLAAIAGAGLAYAISKSLLDQNKPHAPIAGGFSSMNGGVADYFAAKPIIASVTAKLTEQVGLLLKNNAFGAAQKLTSEIFNIRSIAGNPILLGDLSAKRTMASAVKMRNDLMTQLHITKLQADAIIKSIFNINMPDKVLGQAVTLTKGLEKYLLHLRGAITLTQSLENYLAPAWSKISVRDAINFASNPDNNTQYLQTYFGAIGSTITKGLHQGVLTGTPAVLHAQNDLDKKIIGQSVADFDSHSPSRVFIPIGESIPQGLAQGILAGTPIALAAMAQMSSKMMASSPMSLGSLSGGAQAAHQGRTSGTVASIVNRMSAQRHWSASDWEKVIARESGGSLTATNGSSGAYGIAQFIEGPGEYRKYGGNSTTYQGQLTAMANYIASRYGNPTRAWQHEMTSGWYDQGGYLPTGASIAVNNTGRPEPVGITAAGGSPTFVLQFPPGLILGSAEDVARQLEPMITRIQNMAEARRRRGRAGS